MQHQYNDQSIYAQGLNFLLAREISNCTNSHKSDENASPYVHKEAPQQKTTKHHKPINHAGLNEKKVGGKVNDCDDAPASETIILPEGQSVKKKPISAKPTQAINAGVIAAKPLDDTDGSVYLTDQLGTSKKKNNADTRKMNALKLAKRLQETTHQNLAKRMNECSKTLWMHAENGQLKLFKTFRCKSRHCPICARIKANKATDKYTKVFESLLEKAPNSSFLFFTANAGATVETSKLKERINVLSSAASKFITHLIKTNKNITGAVRSIEVTDGDAGSGMAHAHVHIIFHVKPRYFKHSYLSAKTWRETWQKYAPDCHAGVDVRKCHDNKGKGKVTLSAALEAIKYGIKPQALTNSTKWSNDDLDNVIAATKYKKQYQAYGSMLETVKALQPPPPPPPPPLTDDLIMFTFSSAKQRYVMPTAQLMPKNKAIHGQDFEIDDS